MMRSLFSGVSGLRVHQTKMDVIAHNIANVNTIGYKSSRATFMDAFYQRLMGASGPNYETGRAGQNPMQIGLGANIGSIDNIMTQGASQRTDNAFDAMIQGNGFFIVSDSSGTYFTRAGNIKVDGFNNLHINGMSLMGWDVREVDGQWQVQSGPVQPLNLRGDKQYMPPKTTTIVDIIGNLNPNEVNANNIVNRTMSFYTTDGTLLTVDIEFEYIEDRYSDGPAPPDFNSSVWVYRLKRKETIEDDGTITYGGVIARNKNDDEYELEVLYGSATSDVDDVGYLKFDINGSLKAFGYASVATTGGDTVYTLEQNMYVANEPPRMSLFITPETALDPRAAIGNIGDTGMAAMNGTDAIRGVVSLDFTEFTQFDGERITAKILYRNGNAPGSLEDYSIGGDGKITGRYSNGETRLLGQIPVAKFRNPAGLEKVGSNLYVETANSGQFDGTGDTGDIMGGALEMSNVDLSQEFTEMITTQRGFQANSRVITVSDDMLAELVNLKR